MLITNKWKEYECLDAGEGEKLERWNNVVLRRPEPNALWKKGNNNIWTQADAVYHRSDKGGGFWEKRKKFNDYWCVRYKSLTFKVSPTGFKHTGLFPEQASNWDFIINKIQNSGRKIKVLNLFGYTGGATVAASFAGADVVHVDASLGMNEWAKENIKLNKLENNKVRFITDDCLKFVKRELRRGNKYDAIIMDPPTYGRGPNKELWKFEDNLYNLIEVCLEILSDNPLFILISSYTKGVTPTLLENIMKTSILEKFNKGKITCEELCLPITEKNLILPCGICGRWENE